MFGNESQDVCSVCAAMLHVVAYREFYLTFSLYSRFLPPFADSLFTRNSISSMFVYVDMNAGQKGKVSPLLRFE